MTRSLVPIEDAQTPPYTRMALASGYNAFMIVVLATAAFLSGESWLWALALGLEAAWLYAAPRVPAVRRGFDRAYLETRRRRWAEEMQAGLLRLPEEDRKRVVDLERLRLMIHEAWRANSTLRAGAPKAGEGDAARLERLIRAFVKIALQAARFERHVESTDLASLEAEVKRQRTIVEKLAGGAGGTDRETTVLSKRNLHLLERRVDKATAVRQRLRVARSQLQLIENTVRLFHDQLMALESPEALSEQLDDLLSSIDVIESSGKDLEALMRQLDADRLTTTLNSDDSH